MLKIQKTYNLAVQHMSLMTTLLLALCIKPPEEQEQLFASNCEALPTSTEQAFHCSIRL
jgi:nucleoside permease NupC